MGSGSRETRHAGHSLAWGAADSLSHLLNCITEVTEHQGLNSRGLHSGPAIPRGGHSGGLTCCLHQDGGPRSILAAGQLSCTQGELPPFSLCLSLGIAYIPWSV